MATIKAGAYRWNDVLTQPPYDDGRQTVSANFTVSTFIDSATAQAIKNQAEAGGIQADFVVQDYSFACVYSALRVFVNNGEGDKYFILSYENPNVSVAPYDPVVEQLAPVLLFGGLEAYHSQHEWSHPWYQTITIPYDQDVSDEFEPWFTANTKRLSTITYNGSTIATLNGGQTATLKCKGMKMESDVVVEVAEQPESNGGNANIVPLLIGDSEIYDTTSPYIVSQTLDGSNTTIDASFEVYGITLPYMKLPKFVSNNTIYRMLTNSSCTIAFNGMVTGEPTEFDLPISEMVGACGDYGVTANAPNMIFPLVVWTADDPTAILPNAAVGFESNSVYLLNLWQMDGTSGTLTLTALGKDGEADGFMPVKFSRPVETLTVNSLAGTVQHFEDAYYKEVIVYPPSSKRITVAAGTELKYYHIEDNVYFDSVEVSAIDTSQMHILCGICLKKFPKTKYVVGDPLDTSEGVLLVQFTNGQNREVALGKLWVSGFEEVRYTPGVHTLTITYIHGYNDVTQVESKATYQITVSAAADYTVSVGDTFSIAYEGNSPTVECPDYLTYQDDGGELVFTGVSVGSGTIKLIRSSEVFAEYTVEVTA